MRKLLPLLGICLMTAAACVGASEGSATPVGSATSVGSATPVGSPAVSPGYVVPTGPNNLVLRIASGGGFVAPAYLLTEVPQFALFGDGRIIVPGPLAEISPGPLLPNMLVMRVTPAEIQKIMAAADRAGLLGPDASFDAVGIADAGTTVFTTIVDGRAHRISAYALSEAGAMDGGPTGDPTIAAARARLSEFRAQMSNLPAFLRRTVEDIGAYVPSGMRVFVRDAGPADPAQPTAGVAAWPLTTDPASIGQPTMVEGTVCLALTGSDLSRFLAVAGTANAGTLWTYGSARYAVTVRPLYPNESGCAGGAL